MIQNIGDDPETFKFIQSKLKTKGDLYRFMCLVKNVWLPQEKYTSLNFMQAILSGEKKHIKTHEIKMRRTEKYWGEFAVKNVYHLFKDNEAVQEYLPMDEMDQGRYPDRMFVWGILYTLNYDWAEGLYQQVTQKRLQQQVQNPFKGRLINIQQEWLESFKHDLFVPKSKGKNQSIFLQKLVKPYTQRKKRDYKVNYSTFDSQLDNLPSLRSSIDQSDKDKSEGEEFHDIKDLDQSQAQQSVKLQESFIQDKIIPNKKRNKKLFEDQQIQAQHEQDASGQTVGQRTEEIFSPKRKKMKENSNENYQFYTPTSNKIQEQSPNKKSGRKSGSKKKQTLAKWK